MSLELKIIQDIKTAMLSKDKVRLEVCRAIKSAILLYKTEKNNNQLTEKKEIEILQKLYKQRNEAFRIFSEQKRFDLSEQEKLQADIIMEYLPQPYTLEELELLVDQVIKESNLGSKKDMGKLIGLIISKVKGRADGQTISKIVKQKLS